MRSLILLLIFYASFQATASNPGEYLSNLMCSDQQREKTEAALFPTDGSDSFYQKKANDPNKWYSMDFQTMKEYCWAFRTAFRNLDYKGVGRHWECGHLTYRCYYDPKDDDDDDKKSFIPDDDGGNNEETPDDDGGGNNEETPGDGTPGDPDAA